MLARVPAKADIVQCLHVTPHERGLQLGEDCILSETPVVRLLKQVGD